MSSQRLGHLYACLHVVKQFFDLFFTIAPAEYTSLALPYLTGAGAVLQQQATNDRSEAVSGVTAPAPASRVPRRRRAGRDRARFAHADTDRGGAGDG